MKQIFQSLTDNLIPLLLAVSFILTPGSAISEAKRHTADFLKVVNGDTIVVEFKGNMERVRLIGIDAPESTINKKVLRNAELSNSDIKTITELGQRSKQFLKSLLPQNTILDLEFDVRKRDKYGRLLAYAFLKNGQMLNVEILRAGYASLIMSPANVKYMKLFKITVADAMKNERGFWKIAEVPQPGDSEESTKPAKINLPGTKE